jgi:predicted AlkP superfamily phosphohydrolase/phosphomutase
VNSTAPSNRAKLRAMVKQLSIGTALGALIGLAWWAGYSPRAYSLVLLLALHALLGGLWAAAAWVVKAREPLPVVLGLLMGLVVAPAALAPLHQAGLLGGSTGALVDVAVVGVAVLTGLRWYSAAAMGPALVALGLFGNSAIPSSSLPTAKFQEDFYTTGPAAIIGIDGADWQVMDPLLAEGKLPNLAALIESGQHGVLWSSEPMASPVVWTTIFTGHTPDNHGLEDWYKSDARSRKVPALWDIYEAHDKPSLTINIPGSWPPSPMDVGQQISGFPIPGMASGDTGHLAGLVLDAGEHTVPLSSPEVEAVLLSNQLIDTLAREQVLPVSGYSPTWTVSVDGGQVRIEGDDILTQSLAVGEHSAWISLQDDIRVKFVGLDSGVLVSPAFQSPVEPRHAYASNVEAEFLDGDVPYVVEGIGWTAHRDDRIAHVVPELLFETEERHLQAAEALLKGNTPDLFGYVFTATDRLQHPYWSLHETDAYEGVWTAPSTLAGQDYVVQAYIEADKALGRLVKLLPGNTTLFVVSDHGVSAEDPKHHKDKGEAGHRTDGIWIAAGPNIDPRTERSNMRVVDVVPTLLTCVGAPTAEDFDGQVVPICGDNVAVVDTYLGEAGSGIGAGDDTMKQIESLGYIEGDDD